MEQESPMDSSSRYSVHALFSRERTPEYVYLEEQTTRQLQLDHKEVIQGLEKTPSVW